MNAARAKVAGGPPSWWPPVYQEILDDFGWAEKDDQASADALRTLVPPQDTFRHVGTELKHRSVATVVGCGPELDELDASALAGVVVAADGATARLRELGVVPRVVVTDLDGPPDALHWAAEAGASMVVHAHGANQERIEEMTPRLGPFVAGTYQSTHDDALAPLRNVGGFTDGDRAVALCAAYGVREIRLAAFDLSADPDPRSGTWDPATKARKLEWAGRCLAEMQEAGVNLRGA